MSRIYSGSFNSHNSEFYIGNDRPTKEVSGFEGRSGREYDRRPTDAKYGPEYARSMRKAALARSSKKMKITLPEM